MKDKSNTFYEIFIKYKLDLTNINRFSLTTTSF